MTKKQMKKSYSSPTLSIFMLCENDLIMQSNIDFDFLIKPDETWNGIWEL